MNYVADAGYGKSALGFNYFNRLNSITLLYRVQHLKSFDNFAEYRVMPIEVLGIIPVVADEKLGTARISSCVCHREHSAIVKLVFTIQLAVYGVPGAS